MRKCPFCLQEIPAEAKVCKHCGKTVVKKCPACAGEIVATAKLCRYCNSTMDDKPAPQLRSDAPCGERREVMMTVFLIILTCGIYGLVVQYKIGSEINRHQGRNQINAGMDLVLLFLTCGLWGFYMMYKYPSTLMEIIQEEGGTSTDLVLPCILFAILGMHVVSLLILQGELNKHWELHQASKV